MNGNEKTIMVVVIMALETSKTCQIWVLLQTYFVSKAIIYLLYFLFIKIITIFVTILSYYIKSF